MPYDPLNDPFDLPVQVLHLDCVAKRPLAFLPHAGALPGTTLWGAFGDVFLEGFCLLRRRGQSVCGEHGCGCLLPESCPGRWLYKPRSLLQNRDLARPVLLSSADLETGEAVSEFRLQAVLWGRHALAAKDLVVEVLQRMGERGLNADPDDSEPVRFEIERLVEEPAQAIAQRVATLAILDPSGFRSEFQTPFLLDMKRHAGRPRAFSLADVLGGCAFDLAAWDLEDRELPDLDKPRHKFCLDARDAARAAVEGVEMIDFDLVWCDIGERVSRGNGSPFRLQGFVGEVEFSGDIEPLLPWLCALELGGGGAKRPWGFGRVRVDWAR